MTQKKTQQFLFTIVFPLVNKIEQCAVGDWRDLRPDAIADMKNFKLAGVHFLDGYASLETELDDLLNLLCAGEPENSPHYLELESTTMRDSVQRLEMPGGVFYDLLRSKVGRLLRNDADRKFRGGAADGIAISLINNIAFNPQHLGLDAHYFTNVGADGFNAAYQEAIAQGIQKPSMADLKKFCNVLDTSAMSINQALDQISSVALEKKRDHCVGLVNQTVCILLTCDALFSHQRAPSLLLKLKQELEQI